MHYYLQIVAIIGINQVWLDSLSDELVPWSGNYPTKTHLLDDQLVNRGRWVQRTKSHLFIVLCRRRSKTLFFSHASVTHMNRFGEWSIKFTISNFCPWSIEIRRDKHYKWIVHGIKGDLSCLELKTIHKNDSQKYKYGLFEQINLIPGTIDNISLTT